MAALRHKNKKILALNYTNGFICKASKNKTTTETNNPCKQSELYLLPKLHHHCLVWCLQDFYFLLSYVPLQQLAEA